MKSLSLAFMLSVFLVSCSTTTPKPSKKLEMTKVTLFSMSNSPMAGTTLAGQNIKMGGFSGLIFTGEKDGSLFFQTVTDRGPNAEMNGKDRPFLLPEFSPTLITLKADPANKDLVVSAEFKLKKIDGSPLTGLPNDRNNENPTDIFGLYYSVDSSGLDIEGLVLDGEGGYWMADEYGPSLVRFNEQGVMLRRLMPSQELPRMYADRKTNRGFEAVAKVDNKLFGFLQSPLPKEEFSRIVEVDLETMKTSAEYFYPFEQGNDKIGDAVAIGPKMFLVLEQNGKVGEASVKRIYRITLGETDQLVQKTLIADLKNTPFNNVEKVEGITLIDDQKVAVVYDNDFQLNGKINPASGLATLNENPNQLLVLEFSDNLKETKGL